VAKQPTSTSDTPGSNKSGARSITRPRGTAAGGTRGGGGATAARVRTPSIATFVQESWSELQKVTWPTPQETMNLTVAVIGMTVGIAVFLGVVDALLDYIIKPILGAK
jgi:preprotein translocase SecE subunit